MYAEHATAIGAAMREDPEIFKRGALFALLSIRQPITSLAGQMQEVEERRAEAACLFGFKRAAYRHIEFRGRALWEHLHWHLEQDGLDPGRGAKAAIRALLEVPGLGIVKAAFVAQLFGFDVACIDSRNAEREGRKRDAFKFTKGATTPQRIERLLDLYLSVTYGRAREYWDAWCEYVALDYGYTGEQISAMHLAILPENDCHF